VAAIPILMFFEWANSILVKIGLNIPFYLKDSFWGLSFTFHLKNKGYTKIHHDNTCKDFAQNYFTYKIDKYNITCMFLTSVMSEVIHS
jgi:hypothetical protein